MSKKTEYSTLSEYELINLFKEGNDIAYTELYYRHSCLMLGFAYKKLRDEELAKDFVQELFANLWIKRESVLVTRNFSAFLYTTLRHKIIDHFIHQKVETKYITFLKNYIPDASSEKPDYPIRYKELSLYIEDQINALPPKMRVIFQLSRKEQLTYKEIAKELSISEKTVNSQMVNALNRLRIKLGLFLYLICLIRF